VCGPLCSLWMPALRPVAVLLACWSVVCERRAWSQIEVARTCATAQAANRACKGPIAVRRQQSKPGNFRLCGEEPEQGRLALHIHECMCTCSCAAACMRARHVSRRGARTSRRCVATFVLTTQLPDDANGVYTPNCSRHGSPSCPHTPENGLTGLRKKKVRRMAC
jgi:hypothetical protein